MTGGTYKPVLMRYGYLFQVVSYHIMGGISGQEIWVKSNIANNQLALAVLFIMLVCGSLLFFVDLHFRCLLHI
jgi:hypothetical protein